MWPFAWIFLAAGAALLYGARRAAQAARRAESWPVVPGRLEHCAVVERGVGRDDLTTFHLDLRYSYVVNGARYVSTRYAFSHGDPRDDGASRAIAGALTRMTELVVRYDPRRPSEAVLSTEVHPNVAMLGWWGIALSAVSALIAVVAVCR